MHRGNRLLPLLACWGSAVLASLVAGPAFGQVQGYPVESGGQPSGPVVGGAVVPARGVEVGPVDGYPVYRPEPASADRVPPGWSPPTGTAATPGQCREPGQCDDRFRHTTTSGWVCEGFPRSLLWEPPMASLREPRLLFMPTTLSNDTTDTTLDTAIGTTVGLFRVGSGERGPRIQLDVFGLVLSRLSNYDYLVESHYRAGFPVTIAYGPWHAKIGYEHTSTHLGDETLVRTGRQPIEYVRDEVAFGLGRWLCGDTLRVYGQAGWAFFVNGPDDASPFRFDVGFEWYRRQVTGFRGQPFAAGNVEFNGMSDYEPTLSLQAGWQWRDPGRRLAQTRVFVQYYTGRSVYGQFYQDQEDWVGIGLALDY